MTQAQPNSLFIDTPRLRFHCRTFGAPDGIPVLLLHGSFGTSRWWERVGALLPSQVYAVAPDLRGCGQSEKTDWGYAVAEQALDLQGLIDALGWVECHLVAHSSSGAIAVEVALTSGAPLATLTLVDSVPIEGVFTPIDSYLLLEQMRTDRDLLRQALALLMPAVAERLAESEADAKLFDQIVADAAQMAPAAFTAIAQGLTQWNRFADARQLTLPTLLVWGDRDPIVDRDATTRTLIAIPGAANLEIIRGAGHCPMLEAPQVLVDRFVDFIVQDFAGFEGVRARGNQL
jgi:branched-chain amino acid transport system permease protein